jgi:hypothetical protein
MVARSDSIAGLKASDSNTCLQALREVRNQVIGSKQKKSQYLQHGVLQQVLALLGSSKNSDVLVQCAAVVGSLAYQHDDAVRDIVAHDGIAVLLRCLSHEEPAVVQAAARTLKLVYQVQPVDLGPADHVQMIVARRPPSNPTATAAVWVCPTRAPPALRGASAVDSAAI